MDFYSYFNDKNIDAKFYVNEELKNHTNFKTGGICPLIITPNDENSLIEILRIIKENKLRYFILGSGANVLFLDEGYDGIVIKLSSRYAKYSIKENVIEAFCGISIFKLSILALKHNLSGMEFAFGIPGTLGGAIFMNAGAYGGEFKNIISSVKFLDEDNNIIEKKCNELDFSYRHSLFSDNNYCIISAKLNLNYSNYVDIKVKMNELIRKRLSKQPYFYPSAGSTFKRPEGNYASYLIETCGLKGVRVNGACVSEKHSGFIINDNNATSKDILDLIGIVKEKVYKNTGYNLECEVQIIK